MSSATPDQPASDAQVHPPQVGVQGQGVFLQRNELYQGVVPHPEHIRQFEDILPGAAQRFFEFADREQQHRHAIDHKIIGFQGRNERLGIWMNALAMLVIAGFAGWFLVERQFGYAITCILSGIVPFYGALIWRRASAGAAQEDKADEQIK